MHKAYEIAQVCEDEELVGGAVCVGGQEKEWMECLLDNLRGFGIDADQLTSTAQEEGDWRKVVKQEAERLMVKGVAVGKVCAGLRYEVVCLNVTGRIKNRIAQSGLVRTDSLAMVY